MPWTSQSVVTHLTDYFRPFPGAALPEWLPIAPWQAHLVKHCRAKADHSPIRWLCREAGWPRSSHYRKLNKSSQTVADSLNLEAACR
jgi:hypothetical protein